MLGLTFTGLSAGALGALYGGLASAMVLLYLLKLRRRRVAVPFSPLWATVVSERQSSALFRRLKRLWSLMLQLLLLALVVGALGDPRPEGLTGCGFAPPEPPPTRHTLLLVDTSASMSTLSQGERRFDAALKAAERVLAASGANPEHRLMVAAVDVQVRPLTLWTTDREIARAALETLRQEGPRGTPTHAQHTLEVATQVLRGRAGAEAVWITDQAFDPPAIDPELPLRVLPVGQPGVNVGLEGFNVRPALDDGLAYAIFFAIRNTSDHPLKATVHLYANEDGVTAHDFVQEDRIVSSVALTIPPNTVLPHVLTDVSFEGSRLAARVALDTQEAVHDVFDTDDVAFAVVPPRKRLAVQLVTEGNLFLQASLFLRENVDLTVVAPADYRGPQGHDVTFVDRASVDLSPPGRYVLFDPPEGGVFEHLGRLDTPRVTRVRDRHPLVKGLTFADAGIAEASKLKVERGDEVVVKGPGGAPLILTRQDPAGSRTFVAVAFDIRRSLLPVSYAFPLLVVNALNWYQPQPDGLLPTRRAGVPLSVATALEEGPLQARGPAPVALRRVEGRLHFTAPEVGLYDFTNAAAETLTVAVNLMDAAESDVTPRGTYPTWEAPPAWVPPAPPWPGTPWRALLMGALALILIEWWTWHRRVTV